jgi:hypothetical protein
MITEDPKKSNSQYRNLESKRPNVDAVLMKICKRGMQAIVSQSQEITILARRAEFKPPLPP